MYIYAIDSACFRNTNRLRMDKSQTKSFAPGRGIRLLTCDIVGFLIDDLIIDIRTSGDLQYSKIIKRAR